MSLAAGQRDLGGGEGAGQGGGGAGGGGVEIGILGFSSPPLLRYTAASQATRASLQLEL